MGSVSTKLFAVAKSLSDHRLAILPAGKTSLRRSNPSPRLWRGLRFFYKRFVYHPSGAMQTTGGRDGIRTHEALY